MIANIEPISVSDLELLDEKRRALGGRRRFVFRHVQAFVQKTYSAPEQWSAATRWE
jgi:hypothetical protein